MFKYVQKYTLEFFTGSFILGDISRGKYLVEPFTNVQRCQHRTTCLSARVNDDNAVYLTTIEGKTVQP